MGKNTRELLAEMSGRTMDMNFTKLSAKFANEVARREAEDLVKERKYLLGQRELSDLHLDWMSKVVARELEKEAERSNGNLPVASVFDSLQVVKHAHKSNPRDVGLSALETHLDRMWKKDREGSLTASQYLTLKEHYTRNFPKSAAVKEAFEAIGEKGYSTLSTRELAKIAQNIRTQEDFEYEMRKAGLVGNNPHNCKARMFVLALVNGGDDSDKDAYFGGGFSNSVTAPVLRPEDEEDIEEDVLEDVNRQEASKKAQSSNVDSFVRQYVETALWSTNDESDERGGDPLDSNYTIDDIDSETLDQMVSDCNRFQEENAELLAAAYEATGQDSERAAHDFWLTRNGHGAGFWDGDWDTEDRDFGKELTTASKKFGEFDLYVGDDGMVYGSPLSSWKASKKAQEDDPYSSDYVMTAEDYAESWLNGNKNHVISELTQGGGLQMASDVRDVLEEMAGRDESRSFWKRFMLKGASRKKAQGKFSDERAEELWDMSMEGVDEQAGDQQDNGVWYGLLKDQLAIVYEDDRGFVGYEEFEDESSLMEAWSSIEEELATLEEDEERGFGEYDEMGVEASNGQADFMEPNDEEDELEDSEDEE